MSASKSLTPSTSGLHWQLTNESGDVGPSGFHCQLTNESEDVGISGLVSSAVAEHS